MIKVLLACLAFLSLTGCASAAGYQRSYIISDAVEERAEAEEL